MSKMTDDAKRTLRFLRSRGGTVVLFALVCFISAFIFAPYMSPVLPPADNDPYYFSENTEARETIVPTEDVYAGSEETVVRVYPDSEKNNSKQDKLYNVTVRIGGQDAEYVSKMTTVRKFLKINNIELGENDIVTPALGTNIYDCVVINIDRVTYEESVTNEIITSKTVKVETDELFVGDTQVVSAGSDGIKTIVTRTTYVNGVNTGSEVISEEVTTPPVNRIVNVGTRPRTAANAGSGQTFTDASKREVSYTQVLKGTGTAYTQTVGTTSATGRVLSIGVVAVDPEKIPYGTRLYITSADGKFTYGYALAADTNDAVLNGDALVGLYYDTDSQCKVFGERDVIVYVLDEN